MRTVMLIGTVLLVTSGRALATDVGSDERFFMEMAQNDRVVIELSQRAACETSSVQVKDLARRLVSDRERALADATQLTQDSGVTRPPIPAGTSAQGIERCPDRLNGWAFDSACTLEAMTRTVPQRRRAAPRRVSPGTQRGHSTICLHQGAVRRAPGSGRPPGWPASSGRLTTIGLASTHGTSSERPPGTGPVYTSGYASKPHVLVCWSGRSAPPPDAPGGSGAPAHRIRQPPNGRAAFSRWQGRQCEDSETDARQAGRRAAEGPRAADGRAEVASRQYALGERAGAAPTRRRAPTARGEAVRPGRASRHHRVDERAANGAEQELLPILEAISKEQGLQLMFSAADAGLVWAEPDLDLTMEVVKRLDATSAGSAAATPPAPAPPAPAKPWPPARVFPLPSRMDLSDTIHPSESC